MTKKSNPYIALMFDHPIVSMSHRIMVHYASYRWSVSHTHQASIHCSQSIVRSCMDGLVSPYVSVIVLCSKEWYPRKRKTSNEIFCDPIIPKYSLVDIILLYSKSLIGIYRSHSILDIHPCHCI